MLNGNGRPMQLFVAVRLVCQKCGTEITQAYQFRGQHPRAGQSHLDARGAELRAAPNGSMRVTATCGKCGSKPVLRWQRVLDALEVLDAESEQNWSTSLPI